MKIFFFCFACFLLNCILLSGCSSPSFLPGTTDIPQMPDLRLDTVDTMDFDTPAGQIMMLDGTIENKSKADVYAFYNRVLPEFGWKQISEGFFKREHDILRIFVSSSKEDVSAVHFEISLSNE